RPVLVNPPVTIPVVVKVPALVMLPFQEPLLVTNATLLRLPFQIPEFAIVPPAKLLVSVSVMVPVLLIVPVFAALAAVKDPETFKMPLFVRGPVVRLAPDAIASVPARFESAPTLLPAAVRLSVPAPILESEPDPLSNPESVNVFPLVSIDPPAPVG